MKYTLGIDVGTNSLGWAIVKTTENSEPINIEKIGSRIFTDGRNPKDQTTLASKRRQKRHERRRRDRFKQRKKLVLNQLIKMGLFPTNTQEQQELKSLDVLTLRAKAVTDKISNFELGRVLFNLNLRRGFKSNRKGGSAEDAKNKITERIEHLKQEMSIRDLKTVGKYLFDRYKKGLSTKATIENDFHLLRQLLEDEFDKIIETQSKYHKSISIDQWNELKNKMFHQRPLKPVETGKCAIYGRDGNHYRTFKYMPSFEYYRFLTELYNLSYLDENFNTQSLTTEQIEKIFNEFKNSKEISYSKIKKNLKLSNVKFSIEDTKEKIKNSTSNNFFSKDLYFGDDWGLLDLALKDKIAKIYFSDKSSTEIKNELAKIKVDAEIINNLPEEIPNIPEATCSYSAEALQKIVTLILEEKRHPTLIIDDLLKNEKTDETSVGKLAYYGASIPESMQPIPSHIQKNNLSLNEDEKVYGKIANPTVHAALNQIKVVVNEIIDQYGKPENIHIEFARDLKKSKEEKNQDRKKQKDNEDRNNRAKEFIEKHKEKSSAFNFERVKLWFELEAMNNQMCVYSGKTISARMVLSDEVQVDHILPFSRTLDDGLSNKVLVLASENVKKGNQTPYEAFHKNEEKWAAIQERAKKLPPNKQWRFANDAIKKFEEKEQFLQRHLNDTRYISKIAKKYLGTIVESNKIVTSKGQMTSIIRGKLGLNQFIQNEDGTKNREDHRHHAIDALTIALTSRGYLKQISTLTAKNKDPNKIAMPQPWDGFIEVAKAKFNEILVSHKVDHGKNGPFMEETCFGLVKNPNKYEEENDYKLVTTKKIADIKKIETIKNHELQNMAKENGLDNLPKEIKKLRVYDVSKESIDKIGAPDSTLVKIHHGKNRQHSKLYKKGDNNFLAIWHLPKNITLKQEANKKRKIDYIFTPIKTYDLNAERNNLNKLKPHPAAKLISKVYLNDTVAINRTDKGKNEHFILKSININESNNRLMLQKINSLKKDDSLLVQISSLINFKFRKIHISPTGIIKDNGPVLK